MKSGNFYLAVLQNAAKRLKPASPKPNSGRGSRLYGFLDDSVFGTVRRLRTVQRVGVDPVCPCAHLRCSCPLGSKWSKGLPGPPHGRCGPGKSGWEPMGVGIPDDVARGTSFPALELPQTRASTLEQRASRRWAPQQWTTVALAYSKEMDYIQTKRQELTHQKPGAQQPPNPSQTNPKRKGRFPKAKAAQPNTDTGQS